jgi:hypothetical protein
VENKHNDDSYLHRALEINLDQGIYGTFVEIGAGQEVARAFFRAGSASGTVAKTMSAYDMKFSDSIYGREESGRYVCESRLLKMLHREYDLILERLAASRGERSRFFSFANTVATNIPTQGRSDTGHGWMGVTFQHQIGAKPSELIIHARLLGKERKDQQETLGIIGVNIIYSAFFRRDSVSVFTQALMEDLDNSQIEIDMIKTSGEAFSQFDNRLLSLELVSKKFSHSVLFNNNGEVIQPSDYIYKKNILLLRGSFRPPTHVNIDMLNTGLATFTKIPGVTLQNTVVLSELNLSYLQEQADLSPDDFLSRVELLCGLGQNVLVSNYLEYYRLARYLSQLTTGRIGIVLGHNNLKDVFNFDFYQSLEGGGLHALGILFSRPVSMLVYPTMNADQSFCLADDLEIDQQTRKIYNYFKDAGQIIDIENANKSVMNVFSREVLKLIEKKDPAWEKMVPDSVAAMIKERKFFGA